MGDGGTLARFAVLGPSLPPPGHMAVPYEFARELIHIFPLGFGLNSRRCARGGKGGGRGIRGDEDEEEASR